MGSKVFCIGRVLADALRNGLTSDVLAASPTQCMVPAQLRSTAGCLVTRFGRPIRGVTVGDNGEPDKLYKRIELEVRGHDTAVLKSYKWYALEAAKLLDIKVSRTWQPKKVHERWTLLKAPFGKKKHMVQYEMRTHFEVIELKHLTGSTADTYLEYIQRNLPEGVAMKVTKTTLERLPSYIKPPVHETSDDRSTLQEDASK
ncbi:hypothetical protein MRX96_023286 [Rhipicephalus microplus]